MFFDIVEIIGRDAQAALVAREAERQSAGATATEARTSAAGPSTAPSAVETARARPTLRGVFSET